MTVTDWRSFGASVIGPAHVVTGKPNQDSWASFHHPWADGVVVSDGLGSKPHSDWGSAATCRAVELAVSGLSKSTSDDDSTQDVLLTRIQEEWFKAIEPLSPRDCAATCVFAVADSGGQLRLGLLGDGAVIAVLNDGSARALTDDKTGGFSNMTSALSAGVGTESWQTATLSATECVAVMLCTDGVSDDVEDLAGFARGFTESVAGAASTTAARRIRDMLSSWPVPKHSDDKTLACLVREVRADG